MKTLNRARAVAAALIVAAIGCTGMAAAEGAHDHGATTPAAPGATTTERRIKYYRNPMGLPDASPTPKKDSMGMDYIPVYEGEDSDDGSVKLSPGKIQRTGVKSEPATRRTIRSHGEGARHDPTRRAARLRDRDAVRRLRANRSPTSPPAPHVRKGQPLMEIYSPALSSAPAEYLSALNCGNNGDSR